MLFISEFEVVVTDIVVVHAGAVASTGPAIAAPGTSSKADSPSPSNPEPLIRSEMSQNYNNTSNTGRLGNSNHNGSPITDPFAQDLTSIVSTAVPSSPVTSVLNPDTSVDDQHPIVMSLVEPTIATTVSEISSSKDSQQQHMTKSNSAGISVSNQTIQHPGPQFTAPGTQTQEQTNFDAAGRSGIKKSVATPYQPVEQPDQAQQARIISQQQQQGQETSQQMSLQQQAKPVVIWNGIMEVTEYNSVSFS